MNVEQHVIYLPQRQAPVARTLYSAMTLLAWAAYGYLWLPLVTLLVWVVGVRTAYIEAYLLDRRIDPALLVLFPTMLLACATLLIGWAEYNRWRYRGRDRRHAADHADMDAIAETLRTPLAVAVALAGAKVATLTMDPHGTPLALQTHTALRSEPRAAHRAAAPAAPAFETD